MGDSDLFLERVGRGAKYDRPDYSLRRNGPGEKGAGVSLSGDDKIQGDKDIKEWFMNVRAR